MSTNSKRRVKTEIVKHGNTYDLLINEGHEYPRLVASGTMEKVLLVDAFLQRKVQQ